MAIQISQTVQHARLDTIETTIGTAPTLEIRTGAQPANCAAADSGSLLVSITLPSDWMSAAASGVKQKTGTWQGTASGAGTAAHYRIKQGATCHLQGSVGQGSGDISLDNAVIAVSQVVTITAYEWNEGND